MARKILLADDSVTAQNMGRKILTDAGYEVMTVNNGSAALKRVTEQKPELVVLDVYMPGYSGLEVCQRLKDSRETSRIPILLTVGKLEPFKPEDARRVGADAFIVKPFEASELLSALTRLEDRIVPQGEGSRFATTVSGIERFAGDPAVKNQGSGEAGEQGWKSRIRFPSKKQKKEEPEPEPDFATPSAFRELRDEREKKSSAATVPETPVPRQEPGLVPDIPHDITPDELDALSALVAKLDGPIPQAEEVAPIGDKIGPRNVVSEVKAELAAPSSSEAATTPVESTPTTEEAANAEAPTAAETNIENVTAAAASTTCETAAPPSDYTPAPIDKDDEPFFATAASGVPSSVEVEAASSEQSKPPASEEGLSQAGAPEQVSAPVTKDQPPASKEVEKEKDQSKVEEMLAEAVAEKVVAEQLAVGEDRVPTEEELAEALRLLTPVQEMVPERAEAAESREQQASACVTEAQSGNGPRWIAEAVELSPHELSVSLEAEMFRTLAPASLPASVPEPPAAVETPLALSVAAGATETGSAEVAISSPSPAMEAAAVSTTSAEPAPRETAAGDMTEQAPAYESHGETAPQEPVPATFASQYAREGSENESSSQSRGEVVPEPGSAADAALANHEETTGDQETMSKHLKTDKDKGSKAGWHQIHATAPAGKTDIESAKHSESEMDESPKAMAAAAASDDASSTSAPDSSAIAHIVDSVLADLRPRIVEEIAKKLAKK